MGSWVSSQPALELTLLDFQFAERILTWNFHSLHNHTSQFLIIHISLSFSLHKYMEPMKFAYLSYINHISEHTTHMLHINIIGNKDIFIYLSAYLYLPFDSISLENPG